MNYTFLDQSRLDTLAALLDLAREAQKVGATGVAYATVELAFVLVRQELNR